MVSSILCNTMGKVWTIVSGKGGVGKSSIAAALAVQLAKSSLRTVVIDADIGLGSLDILFGLSEGVRYELKDSIEKLCCLNDALTMHPVYPSLSLLMGGQNAKPGDFSSDQWLKVINTLKKNNDTLLIDGPAGIGRGFKNLLGLSDEFILVATPDPVCLRDTHKTADLIGMKTGITPCLILNQADKALLRRGAAQSPQAISSALKLPLLGVIQREPGLYRAMQEGKTMAECGSNAVVKSIEQICLRMRGVPLPVQEERAGVINRIMTMLKWRG